MSHYADYSDQDLVSVAVSALVEIENRWRKTQPGLRLPIIGQVIDFGKTFPDDERKE